MNHQENMIPWNVLVRLSVQYEIYSQSKVITTHHSLTIDGMP